MIVTLRDIQLINKECKCLPNTYKLFVFFLFVYIRYCSFLFRSMSINQTAVRTTKLEGREFDPRIDKSLQATNSNYFMIS